MQNTDPPPLSGSASRHILALGGCALRQNVDLLEGYISFKHYWRHNILCDMSREMDISSLPLQDPEVIRFMNKYGTKFHRKLIEQGNFDYLVLECGGDHLFRYLDVDGAIFPDPRDKNFGPGWDTLSFDHIPLLRDAPVLNAEQPAYWELWKDSFERLYRAHLSPLIAQGKQIIFIKRYLCTQFFHENGRKNLERIDIRDTNIILKDVYGFVERFPNITIMEVPEELLFSSSYAAYGGPFEAHPEKEYFDYMAEELLRVCSGAHLADKFRRELMATRMQERVRAEIIAVARDGENKALRAAASEREKALSDLRTAVSERESDLSDLRTAVSERERQVNALKAERDSLSARVAMLNKRYAPVRNAYKALRIGKVKRFVGRTSSTLRGARRKFPLPQAAFAAILTQMGEVIEAVVQWQEALSPVM